METLRRLDRPWLPYAVILAAAIILFAPFFLNGKIFLAADTLSVFSPWRQFAPPGFSPHNMLITDPVNANYAGPYNDQLSAGGLSRWKPHIFTGLPATSLTDMSGGAGRFNPIKLLLHRFLRTPIAFMLSLFLHVLLMGVTMNLYLDSIGAGRRGALFGALAYMLNGYGLVWLEFESVAVTAALLPLLFFVMERFLGPRPRLWAFVGAGVMGLIAVMGMLQYLMYIALLMGCYLLFLLYRAWDRDTGWRPLRDVVVCFAVTAVGGMLIAGIEFLPNIDLIGNSSRIARNFSFPGLFDTLSRITPRYLLTLLFPDFFGSPVLGFNAIPSLPAQEYMNYNELCIYMGVPALLAFLACLVAPQDRFSRFHAGMALLFGSFLMGAWTYYPVFRLFPGMDRMNPTRLTFIASFSFAAAAAFGIRGLESATKTRRTVLLAVTGLFAAAALAIALAAGSPGFTAWVNREMRGGAPMLQALAGLRSLGAPIILRPLLLALGAAALVAGTLVLRRQAARLACFALLLALLGYDLVSFGWRYNTTVDEKQIYPSTPAIAFLQRQMRPFRVMQHRQGGLWVNSLMPYGIEEIGGYGSFYPARANDLLSFIEYGQNYFRGARFDRWVTFGNPDAPLFDLLNVKYVLTAPGIELFDPKLKLVFRGDLAIYENTRALPRAFAVHRHVVRRDAREVLSYMGSPAFDMRGEVVLEEEPPAAFLSGVAAPARPPAVTIDRYEDDREELTVDLAANGWVVTSDAWYPGWKARVDGREAPIARADCNFRAVAVPAGRHTVSFSFEPAFIARGWGLTAAGLLLVLGGCAVSLPRRKPAPAAEDAAG